jgi:RNA polymerase sigma-70 factor (ECF subfamily)
VNNHNVLAAQFEAHRAHLRAVAYRMLGSPNEAEDAVQEAWLRLSRADTSEVGNLGGWLTTVVARVCLDMLRSRGSRREVPLDSAAPVVMMSRAGVADPEQEVLLADSVGLALLVVLDPLTPAERLAFVLHDLFGVPFDEIAPIIGRSPIAARQLASRARRRVQRRAGDEETIPDAGIARRQAIVDAFLAASRSGDFEALLRLLDPDAVLRADEAAVQTGAAREIRGAAEVAKTFAGRARAAQTALLDGVPGLVWMQGGRPRVVFAFTIAGEKVTAIDIVAEPEQIDRLEVTVPD